MIKHVNKIVVIILEIVQIHSLHQIILQNVIITMIIHLDHYLVDRLLVLLLAVWLELLFLSLLLLYAIKDIKLINLHKLLPIILHNLIKLLLLILIKILGNNHKCMGNNNLRCMAKCHLQSMDSQFMGNLSMGRIKYTLHLIHI